MNKKSTTNGLCELCDTHLKRAVVEIKENQYQICQYCAEGVLETNSGVLVTKKMPKLRPSKESV